MAVAVPAVPSGLDLLLDDVKAALNLEGTTEHDDELLRHIAAAEAHVRRGAGDVGVGERTANVTASGGVLLLPVWPVQSVSAISRSGTEYVPADLDVSEAGVVQLASGGSLGGRWTVTYTAGWPDLTDLYLAAVEDIRGLYQGSQIGPASALGAFGDDAATASGFRPVSQWPRIDAWLARLAPGIA